MTGSELLDRLVDRYTTHLDEDARRRLEYHIEQDAVVQLTAFIGTGLKRDDLTDEEVDCALELARQNRLLKDSPY